MTSNKGIVLLTILALISACYAEPRLVYIPSTEPEVELFVRASATEVSVGEPVVLFAERRNRGEWKQVERKELTSGQAISILVRNEPNSISNAGF